MNEEFINKIESKLEEYYKQCDNNLQTYSSKQTYKYHSKKFVEFVKGQFIPGETLK